MNLGWKLAATVRGWAPEGLLDTYTAERHPLGAWVLDWTRAQVALMRPESHARALREVIAELTGTTTATTFFAKKISGVLQRYDLPGDHPLTGRSAPDLELSDGTRLAEHLHGGQGLLLDLAEDAGVRRRATGYGERVRVLSARCPERPGLAGLLVRPDGCTAWAADSPAGRAPRTSWTPRCGAGSGRPAKPRPDPGPRGRRGPAYPAGRRALPLRPRTPDRRRPTPEPAPTALASDHDPHRA